jgi:hypothetical protein
LVGAAVAVDQDHDGGLIRCKAPQGGVDCVGVDDPLGIIGRGCRLWHGIEVDLGSTVAKPKMMKTCAVDDGVEPGRERRVTLVVAQFAVGLQVGVL